MPLPVARSVDRPGAADDVRGRAEAVALVPGSGGILEVRVDGRAIWSRSEDGAAIDPKVIKRRVRDLVAPDRGLGHTDTR